MNFFKKLFCKHEWKIDYQYITKLSHTRNGIPAGSSWELIARLTCNKCNKILDIRHRDVNRYVLLAYINSYLPKHERLEFEEDKK